MVTRCRKTTSRNAQRQCRVSANRRGGRALHAREAARHRSARRAGLRASWTHVRLELSLWAFLRIFFNGRRRQGTWYLAEDASFPRRFSGFFDRLLRRFLPRLPQNPRHALRPQPPAPARKQRLRPTAKARWARFSMPMAMWTCVIRTLDCAPTTCNTTRKRRW